MRLTIVRIFGKFGASLLECKHEKKVGVIGLGAMGSAMALRMVKAGYDVVGTDVRQACMDELAADGGKLATSARAIAEVSDIIIISLASEAAFMR